jgi:surface protein
MPISFARTIIKQRKKMKISKTVKLGLSIALLSIFVGCGDTEDDKKETPNSTNQQENDNSSGDNNSNSGNDNNSEEEAGIKVSSTPFIVKMKTYKNSDKEDVVYIGTSIYGNYNYSIDWGDGTTSSNLVDEKRHLYPNEGTYTISISGVYSKMAICPKSIEQWGDMQWSTMRELFSDCGSNKIFLNATDTPNLSHVTDMSRMFSKNVVFNEDIGSWDVSKVTNMEYMFSNLVNFNQDISSWDVSNVRTMNSIFSGAKAFNQNLSSWDISIRRSTDIGFDDTNLSTENYDQILIGWLNNTNINDYIELNMGNIKYSKKAQQARFELINEHNWDIQDGGLAE